jgi:hypothetical protein
MILKIWAGSPGTPVTISDSLSGSYKVPKGCMGYLKNKFTFGKSCSNCGFPIWLRNTSSSIAFGWYFMRTQVNYYLLSAVCFIHLTIQNRVGIYWAWGWALVMAEVGGAILKMSSSFSSPFPFSCFHTFAYHPFLPGLSSCIKFLNHWYILKCDNTHTHSLEVFCTAVWTHDLITLYLLDRCCAIWAIPLSLDFWQKHRIQWIIM